MISNSPPRFAHESEAELARIFDYYGVPWRYEPDVFPISWNADGVVIESFAPDFYLPEIDLLHRADHAEAVAGAEEEPQAALDAAALPGDTREALLRP